MSDILGNRAEIPIDLQSHPELQPPDWFDEEAYLHANPDVADSLANGEFRSAYHHFTLHGRDEYRPLRPRLEPSGTGPPATEPQSAETSSAQTSSAETSSASAEPSDLEILDAAPQSAPLRTAAPRPAPPPTASPRTEPPSTASPPTASSRTESPRDAEPPPPEWFDEDAYLIANPDVARSLANGEFRSPFHHFTLHGREERRPLRPRPKETLVERPQLLEPPPAASPTTGAPTTAAPLTAAPIEAPAPKPKPKVPSALEAIILSPSGGLFLVGWVNDLASPLEWIEVSGSGWVQTLRESNVTRLRRTDVEAALGAGRIHRYGFFAFACFPEPFDSGGNCEVLVHLSNGDELEFELSPRRVSDIELRNIVLTYVPGAQVFGNREVEANAMLRGLLKDTIVKHNRAITHEIVKGAYVERFGPRPRNLKGSMVVCLYGKPQYLFLQSALFAGGPGFEDYETIYVSNSPEMAEQLLKDAHTGAIVYGLPQTLVLLPGNAGFGAANNVAVAHASSDRILIVNPDVFPRDADWARRHTQIVADCPAAQTQLFGAPLYYDDGSLMHGGMYFEYDKCVSLDEAYIGSHRLVRVEHYGKGAPAFSNRYTRSRPVPAITGAFMSAARAWYEKLGGFTEDFVFGHYEDADLCLKSLSAGVAPWIHDLRLWHMEGKGATRLAVHEGGSHVNRALFSERWADFIDNGLQGPDPSHPLLQDPRESDIDARARAPASSSRGHARA